MRFLKYFFISLNLLLIVLITRSLRFIIEILSERRAYHMEQYFNIEKTDGGFNFSYKQILPEKQLFSLLPNKQNDDLFPRISLVPSAWQKKDQIPLILVKEIILPLARAWNHYRWIYDYSVHFRQLYEIYSPYLITFTSFCYVIGWSYYLFLVLSC